MIKVEKDIKEFMDSDRHNTIKATQAYAKEEGLCKESVDGQCMYPHCSCLLDEDDSINNGLEKNTFRKIFGSIVLTLISISFIIMGIAIVL